uniref:Uncharacterized protein n=1 Tax=Sphaerodactylus townsendi TaxID=933632 RepID=A0ACB8ETQ2_9SAUR
MVCQTQLGGAEEEPQGGAPPPPPRPAQEPPPRAPAGPPAVSIREFQPGQRAEARRIFYEGILERVPNTAFRGLKDQPCAQLAYGAMAEKNNLNFLSVGSERGVRGGVLDAPE